MGKEGRSGRKVIRIEEDWWKGKENKNYHPGKRWLRQPESPAEVSFQWGPCTDSKARSWAEAITSSVR